MTTQDWRFDVGRGAGGEFRVDAYASTIPHKTYIGLSRKELTALRDAINAVLRLYQKPEVKV